MPATPFARAFESLERIDGFRELGQQVTAKPAQR